MIHHLNRPSVPRSLLLASLSALLTLTLSSLASSSPHPPDPARGVPRVAPAPTDAIHSRAPSPGGSLTPSVARDVD